jgi:hypothetical protein
MGAPRVVDAGSSLWLIAADAPLSLYGEPAIEEGLRKLQWVAGHAVAHEQVVEHFAGAGTVIPMKLFTLFANDRRALAYIRKMRKRLEGVIERVTGCQEWGVRIRFHKARAAGAARRAAKPPARTASTGTQFLLLKKQKQDLARRLQERVSAEAESAYQELARCGEDARRFPSAPGQAPGPLVLDAAFLVPLKKEKRFQGAVQRLTARMAHSCDVTLTGPWPPYNFIGESG